jgi:hypothetical protein
MLPIKTISQKNGFGLKIKKKFIGRHYGSDM